MSSAFSGHLVDQFHYSNQPRGPFGQHNAAGPSSISTHGAMSFDPSMHGNSIKPDPSLSQSFSLFIEDQPSYMDLSEATALKIARLQAKLDQKLGPEYISTRPGPGGGPKLTYAEGWKIINLANEVFGFNGWSSSIKSLTTDFIEFNEETKKYNVGVTAIVKVMLRDGVFHEDVGYGALENSKSKAGALDKVCQMINMECMGYLYHSDTHSARRKPSPMRLNVLCVILETYSATACTTSSTPRK